MKPSQKGALLTILIYLWMLVVSGGYFVYHKPFTPQQAVIWLKLCIQMAVTLLTVAGAGGMGLWVIAQFRIPLKSKVLQSAGLGFGMIGSGFFFT